MSQTLTVSTNLIIKKVGCKIEYYILQIFLLVAILLFMIAISSNHYGKKKVKTKSYCHSGNIKMDKNNELKKVGFNNHTCYVL